MDTLQKLASILSEDKPQTIILGDGIAYGNNAGTIVRQCAIYGATSIIFSPLDKARLNQIDDRFDGREIKREPDGEKNNFKNYKLNYFIEEREKIRYKTTFRKSIEQYSSHHTAFVNLFYDIPIETVIDMALKNGFSIFRLENNKSKSIFTTKLNMKKVVFILGNETVGIRQDIMQNPQIEDLYIPSAIRLDSINVSEVATTVCFERFRQMSTNQ